MPSHCPVGHIIGYARVKITNGLAEALTNFWARGYFVSTVGLDEEMVRAYIRNQEKADEHYDQLRLGM